MALRTHRNGGNDSLQKVANAWAKEEHNFPMSNAESDKHTIAFVQRMQAEDKKAGPAVPDPRNIHQG